MNVQLNVLVACSMKLRRDGKHTEFSCWHFPCSTFTVSIVQSILPHARLPDLFFQNWPNLQ